MATFGQQAIGTPGAFNVNKLRVGRFLKPEAGKLSKLTVRVADGTKAAGKAKLKAVIYAVTGGGEGGALLAEGTEVVFTQGEGEKWLDLPLPAEPELATGEYWIGVLLGGEENAVKLFTVEGTANYDGFHNREYTLGAPNPFGEMGRDQFQLSLYATYAPTPPSITKPADQTNTVGIPINEVPVAAENLTTYQASGLPTGLSISSSTGRITGTPSKVEAPTVTLTVKGTGGEASTTFVWHVVSVASAATWSGYTAFSPVPVSQQLGSATCAFNRPVPASPPVLANSAEMVAWLLADAPVGNASHSRNHFPVVFASNTDPQIEILVTESYGRVWDKRKVRIPAAAQVQANGDKHLCVVLSPSDCALYGYPEGTTAEFWKVHGTGSTIEYAGSQLTVAASALGNLNGSLLEPEGSATAADIGLGAGLIRGPELKAGVINHALVAFVHNCRGAFVYPARASDGEQGSLPKGLPSYAPAMGQRFYLAMTDAEIEALGLPHPYQVAVAKALAKYGFYIQDTGDTRTGFRLENGLMYSAFGATDLMKRCGEEQGLASDGEGYKFDYSPLEPVFLTRLRALAPPAPEGQQEAPTGNLQLRRPEVFPPGTLVRAYAAADAQFASAPSGGVVASGTVDATGLLQMTAPSGVALALWAPVEGEHRYLTTALVPPDVTGTLRDRTRRRRAAAGI